MGRPLKIGIIPLGRDVSPTQVTASNDATVADLKRMVGINLNISDENIRLSYFGRSLDDDTKLLSFYKITDNAYVNIVEAPPGGIFSE